MSDDERDRERERAEREPVRNERERARDDRERERDDRERDDARAGNKCRRVSMRSSDNPEEYGELRVAFGNIEREGAWLVPKYLAVRVRYGNAQLDLRDAMLGPGTTTLDVSVAMGNLVLLVPEDLAVQVDVHAKLGNVEAAAVAPVGADGKRVHVIGTVKLGNCEVIALRPGETMSEYHVRRATTQQVRHERAQRDRWKELRAEREMWRREKPGNWMPWWLMARMRRRVFSWLFLALGGGFGLGWYMNSRGIEPRWWWIPIVMIAVSATTGGIAWRLTRPLLLAIRAARDIGDGKLDTRIDTERHGGEVRLLGNAINDMAEKIQKQLSDQRQLLAAVSHELRTPLGHMRVLIETARDQKDAKALNELETEVLVLDDLVGRLLASSRLEFGNLDRRPLDLGELVTDVATAAGVDPDAIEAEGDVRAAVDPTLIRRAIANLLDNARVHGGGAVAVRIVRRGGQVAIEVDDAGPGVTEDRRADAFRAFVPSSGGGLGLGLALVSRIAVAHGGGARITDRPGGGARIAFTVTVAA